MFSTRSSRNIRFSEPCSYAAQTGDPGLRAVLVEGKAIKLHPLVCTAYKRRLRRRPDAVHVPLSLEAQAEARFLMLSSTTSLHRRTDLRSRRRQDMILGSYYLTHPGVEERNTPLKRATGRSSPTMMKCSWPTERSRRTSCQSQGKKIYRRR
jgi:DNA-directed RNA polymerase beta' subunit